MPGSSSRLFRNAHNGYANGDEVAALAESDIEALVATGSSGRRRRYDFRPAKTEVPVKKPKAEWLKVMAAKLDSEEGRALYRLRQQTVEPVFGIIKAALGFTGAARPRQAWDLVDHSHGPACGSLGSIAPPTDDSQITQHRIPTLKIRFRPEGPSFISRTVTAFDRRSLDRRSS